MRGWRERQKGRGLQGMEIGTVASSAGDFVSNL